jgi:hypothetical protein
MELTAAQTRKHLPPQMVQDSRPLQATQAKLQQLKPHHFRARQGSLGAQLMGQRQFMAAILSKPAAQQAVRGLLKQFLQTVAIRAHQTK